ncbi:MAG: type II toxin-antitoxin system HipA family toxin [Oscillospiraceae bacterium]|jgi:serine/threonine-protein kinase HipA
MNCLCCGKPLRLEDEQNGWHKRCIKRFFGTSVLPNIEINEKTLELLAIESTNKGYTVPGVQKKLSLHLISEGGRPRLTLLNYPTGYILKPQVKDFRSLPEAEQLVMCMADAVGIATVPHALVLGNGSYAYITKRVDRVFEKNNKVRILAMEDFCQLDLRLTQDKYKGSYERCSKIIQKYSSRAMLDLTELYMRLVFSYLVGNSDMHLKNFSLIETAEGSGLYVLSPAYDLLPVNIIMPEDEEQFALTMNGKKTNIRKNDFLVFADECDISRSAAEKMIGKLVSMKHNLIIMCRESLLPEDLKEHFISLIEERSKIFI